MSFVGRKFFQKTIASGSVLNKFSSFAVFCLIALVYWNILSFCQLKAAFEGPFTPTLLGPFWTIGAVWSIGLQSVAVWESAVASIRSLISHHDGCVRMTRVRLQDKPQPEVPCVFFFFIADNLYALTADRNEQRPSRRYLSTYTSHLHTKLQRY